jgi:hypothetical protein
MDEEHPHAVIDTSKAHPARVYDYWLGGKDNISQVVSVIPYGVRTDAIQACWRYNSKSDSISVQDLFRTYMGAYIRFSVGVFLTLP